MLFCIKLFSRVTYSARSQFCLHPASRSLVLLPDAVSMVENSEAVRAE